MRRRRRIVFVAVLALLVVGPGAAAILSDPKRFEDLVLGRRSGEVPVVETVGQLRRCRPITLPGGQKVRLGISGDEGPAGSALVLYALVDYPVPLKWEQRGGVRLGLLTLKIEGMTGEPGGPWTAPVEGETLYAADLPLASPGPVELVLSAGLREVARRTVHATDRPWHPFLPFCTGRCGEPISRPDVQRLSPIGAAAVPQVDGGRVRTLPEHPDDPLPTFELPRDPTITLEVHGDRWRIAAPTGAPFVCYGREDHLLARWWVDGRPVVPAPRAPVLREALRNHLHVGVAKALDLHVHVDRAILGAPPGARIELQVAFCPEGWRFLDQEPREDYVRQSGARLRLSNRVAVPGP